MNRNRRPAQIRTRFSSVVLGEEASEDEALADVTEDSEVTEVLGEALEVTAEALAVKVVVALAEAALDSLEDKKEEK